MTVAKALVRWSRLLDREFRVFRLRAALL